MTSARTMEAKLQEIEGFGEEGAGKKKSKFKSIKKFFGKRKRKETLSSGDSSLKPCQSTSDVTGFPSMPIDYDSEDELQMHRSIVGSRALSHESIFISEAPQEPARQLRVFSQENVSDRIRALQAKLQQSWKSGLSSPFGASSKRIDDTGMSSEDDGLPRSPPETSLLQEILNSSVTKFPDPHKHLSSLSLAGTGSEEEEQVPSSPLRSCSAESQPRSRQSGAKILVLQTSDSNLPPPAGFDTPPEFSSCLDNSAAKHKLLIKPRNQRSSRARRPLSRNLSESQPDLSSTLEEDESEQKEILAEWSNEGDSSSHLDLTESTVFTQKPENHKGLQHSLNKQNEKAHVPQGVSELDTLPCGNNPDVCQPLQELSHTTSSSPSSDLKEDKSILIQTPNQRMQREEENTETMKIFLHGFSGGRPLSVPHQDNTWTYNTPSKNNALSDKNASAKNCTIPILDRREKKPLKDSKPLLEEVYNKETTKASLPLLKSTNPSTESSLQLTDLPFPENSSISQILGATPTSQTDRPSPFALDKVKPSQEQPVPEKNHTAKLDGGEKTEKETSELNALKKFPVTLAWGKPRSSSLNMKEYLESENPLTVQVFQAEIKNSSGSETVKDTAADVHPSQEQKRCTKKQASLPELESEIPGRTAGKAMMGPLLQATGAKQTLGIPSTALPQQSSCGDKNPFQIKLRSTSLSVKHRNSSSQETKDSKIHSTEFSLEKEGSPLASLKGEKPEIRKTTDVNSSGFLNENIKMKLKSSDQGSAKPPLPKKPIMQHFIITGTSSNINKQEKFSKHPEFKNEDKDLEKSSPSEVLEKCVPPVSAADPVRTSENQTVPAWITIAKQKQRVLEQEFNKEEKPVNHEKADAEKQLQEKEKMEEAVKQQIDYTRNTFLSFPPMISTEEPMKEAKPDTQESLPRVQLLPHPNTVQSSAPFEKENTKSVKKIVRSCPDQPSWMELAKKKSQAWSDMPQRIK